MNLTLCASQRSVMVVKAQDLESRLLESKYWLHYLLAVWPSKGMASLLASELLEGQNYVMYVQAIYINIKPQKYIKELDYLFTYFE